MPLDNNLLWGCAHTQQYTYQHYAQRHRNQPPHLGWTNTSVCVCAITFKTYLFKLKMYKGIKSWFTHRALLQYMVTRLGNHAKPALLILCRSGAISQTNCQLVKLPRTNWHSVKVIELIAYRENIDYYLCLCFLCYLCLSTVTCYFLFV